MNTSHVIPCFHCYLLFLQRPSGRTKGGKKLGEVKDRNEKYVGMARGKEFMPEQQKQSPRQAQGQQGQHPQSVSLNSLSLSFESDV